MVINIPNFLEYLKKATLNFSIETINVKINSDTIVSKMKTDNSTAVCIIKKPNNILPEIPDELEMNFNDVNNQLKNFLMLFDTEDADFRIMGDDERVRLKSGGQVANVHFCSPHIVTAIQREPTDVEFFHEFELTSVFTDIFNKVKKVANKFGKIYFSVENEVLYIEGTDKLNSFANGIKIELSNVKHPDMNMCLNYKDFMNLMSVLNGNAEDFTAHIAWLEDSNAGMVLFDNEDESEKYYLMSIREENN